jgi:hypothetical protein
VNLVPSVSACGIQPTPSTSMHSVSVGPSAATPQRAITAGSPQARTPGESGSVARRGIPDTVTGHNRVADEQAGSVAAEGTATSTASEEHADSTTAATPSVAAVESVLRLIRRAPPCR